MQYALKYENLTFEQTRATAKHLVDGKSTLWSKIIPRMLWTFFSKISASIDSDREGLKMNFTPHQNSLYHTKLWLF